MVIYSTITIDGVEFQDTEGILNPVPVGPVGLNREITPTDRVNPSELDISGDPPTTEPAFVIAIHAIDPLVGPSPPQGPGGEAPPSQALSNIIGLQVRQAGSYDDIEIPIFPTPQLFSPEIPLLQPQQTFPPNPDGSTDVAATLWYFENGSPNPILVDNEPVQGSATIQSLDQNEQQSPVTVDEMDQ